VKQVAVCANLFSAFRDDESTGYTEPSLSSVFISFSHIGFVFVFM